MEWRTLTPPSFAVSQESQSQSRASLGHILRGSQCGVSCQVITSMAATGLPNTLIGIYQDAFMRSGNLNNFLSKLIFFFQFLIFGREARGDGSVDSSQVSSIMKAIGQNPSEAEIQVRRYILALLSLVQLLHYYALIGRELQWYEIFS